MICAMTFTNSREKSRGKRREKRSGEKSRKSREKMRTQEKKWRKKTERGQNLKGDSKSLVNGNSEAHEV